MDAWAKSEVEQMANNLPPTEAFWMYVRLEQLCRNPNLAKCGGEAQHLEKLGIWSPSGLPNV
jgi:hypothetical protein